MKQTLEREMNYRDMYSFSDMKTVQKYRMMRTDYRYDDTLGNWVLEKKGHIDRPELVEDWDSEIKRIEDKWNAKIIKREHFWDQIRGEYAFRCMIHKDGVQTVFRDHNLFSSLTKDILDNLEATVAYTKDFNEEI